MPADNKDKVTILKLRKQKKNKVKTVGVTAYDYPQALMADNAGVDWNSIIPGWNVYGRYTLHKRSQKLST